MKHRMFLGALVCVCAIAAWAAAAGASASNGATVVQGIQTPVTSGPCYDPAAFGSYTMSGGLVGCWYTDTLVLTGVHPSGTVDLSGTEHFVGCLDLDGNGNCSADDPAGTFTTTFTFTGKYDAAGNELHGRCHHPIVSGSGGFATVGGVIDFTDDVSTGCARYTGSIRL